MITLVTPQEFEEHFAGRPDTDQFFSQLELHEPPAEAAQNLVQHFAEGLSQQYGVAINDQAIRRALLLSDGFIPSSRLPFKAVGILSDACDDLAFDRSQGTSQRDTVTGNDVIRRVSEIDGVPSGT